jgi:hypothetical protein
MIVDWHTHLIPPEESDKPAWSGRCQTTIEKVFDAK